MPLAESAENRKYIERPLNLDVKKLRAKKDREFQQHLKNRREQTALTARGGLDKMENEYLKARHEEELKKIEQIASQYEDNDYCHSVLDEQDMLEEYLKQEQEELEYLTEQLQVSKESESNVSKEG